VNTAQIASIVFGVAFIAALATLVIYSLGELLAAWNRMRADRNWQQWKRKNLRSSK
jgi:hypothetical protein